MIILSEAKDLYSIDLVLRHPSLSPESISRALSLELKGLWTAADAFNKPHPKRMLISVTLQAGDDPAEFENALTNVSQFLHSHTAYWADFRSSGGEIDLILNHTISAAKVVGDKCFELHLAPGLLGQLASTGITLRVQGWQS